MLPSSSPTPLCPLFLPPIWNLDVVDVELGSEDSPNFEKNPFFLTCLAFSSFSPTSSNPSSAVGGCLSNLRSPIADRGSLGNLAASRLCLPISDTAGTTGDLAEIS